ncbi:Nonribosomal peptide synthetase sirP [Colletotrichum fructicola]|nr:Nonribosomal peptide synthetase sirP [Colletotrichum fructicola]KAF4936886.1 Nonribosomal peptide synthetase sirP [Colletotrichum fructicola]
MAITGAKDLRRTDNENSEPLLKTNVLDLFDQHATRSPNGIAAEFHGQAVTYGGLYNASILVALELRNRGFRPRDRVPLVTSMGLEMVASVLGILRLGASYCPIDFKAWSLERVIATLKAVGSRLVLSTVDTTIAGYELVRVPEMLGKHDPITEGAMEELRLIRSDMRQSDLIYIIFTSGTTGKPKGVMVPHSSAAHLVQQSFPGAMRGSPGEKVLLFFSVAFDGCAGVIFSTICHGGTLAMAQPSDVINTASSCSTLILTPSMLASLEPTPEFDCVHSIYMGGEAPTETLVRVWTSPTRKVYNCYGPTECTTAVSTVEMVPGGPIVLGHLVSDVEIVLLDENLENEVPQGEICIRGPCLAVGYLNMEALTQQKFFFRDGVRHYRTGDLARRDEEGLHFVARVDRVVKNRGFLINLEAEVEPALRDFPGVEKAAAFLLQKQLVGFVTPSKTPVETLHGHLAQRFDAFIIPDLIFAIDDFPLTSNGKVDTRALQEMATNEVDYRLQNSQGIDGDKCPALDVVLKAFASIFNRPVSQIPSTASFRGLGGNSLTAVKLQSHLRRANLSLMLGKVFEEPSGQPWDRWESDIPLKVESLGVFARRHGVSSAIVIYTAWALVLTEYTKSDTVGMKISVSGRNIDHPAVERVVGSLNGRCPLLVQTRKDATIGETMRSLQSTFLRVNDYQWTYSELKGHVVRVFGDETYWFDSQVVVLLDMPVDTSHWGIFEVQKPTAPIWLGVIQGFDMFNMRLRYDGSRYANDSVEGMGRRFIDKLTRLVNSPLNRTIGDLGHGSD